VNSDQTVAAYATRLGDNALVLGQRMIELVAASPELEEELANANFFARLHRAGEAVLHLRR